MKLFLILAIFSFVNNFLLTYSDYYVMVDKILQNNFYEIITNSNLFIYFKYILKDIIYWLFFYTW